MPAGVGKGWLTRKHTAGGVGVDEAYPMHVELAMHIAAQSPFVCVRACIHMTGARPDPHTPVH